jgi:hypothetical protein
MATIDHESIRQWLKNGATMLMASWINYDKWAFSSTAVPAAKPAAARRES